MNKILILKLDCGSGYIGFYNEVYLEQLKNFVAKRGCERLIFRDKQITYEMSYKEFNEKYIYKYFK